MGLVYADIELINGDDLALSRRHIIGEEEIKRMQVNILVDTGSYYLCINETIQEQLGLSVLEKRKGQLADGSVAEYDVVGLIEIKFKNRRCHVDAMMLKGDAESLLNPAKKNAASNRKSHFFCWVQKRLVARTSVFQLLDTRFFAYQTTQVV